MSDAHDEKQRTAKAAIDAWRKFDSEEDKCACCGADDWTYEGKRIHAKCCEGENLAKALREWL